MSEGSVRITDRSMEDPVSRNSHQYMVDAFVHSFLQNMESKDLDDAIIVREKNYYYTPNNTPLEKIMEKGSPRHIYGNEKGDLDFAVIYLDDNHVDHFEITESEYSAQMKNYHPEEQIQNAHESVFWTNKTKGTDWSYDHAILFAEDHDLTFDYHPPTYEGEQFCSEDTYEKAKESDAFDALEESFFDGDFWGRKIEKKKEFR